MKKFAKILILAVVLSVLVIGLVACSIIKTVESISVEYSQGGDVVDTQTPLSELRDNLVVTAYYDDGSTKVVTDYTLLGTLEEGQSTVTVKYKSKTATFTVNVNRHVHSLTKVEATPATCTENGNIEYWYCDDCGKYFADEGALSEIRLSDTVIQKGHTGGTEIRGAIEATEHSEGYTGDTYCIGCGNKIADGEVIDRLPHTHVTVKIDRVDSTCSEDGNLEYWYCEGCGKCYEDEGALTEIELTDTVIPKGHKGGTATCVTKATCTACGAEYGEFGGHAPNADDGDCTTDITCSVCGDVTTPKNLRHTGGTATCTERAHCSICDTEYGELGSHSGEIVWMRRHDTHYLVYSCCYESVTTPEAHTNVNGECTVCGYKPTVTVDSVEITSGETVTIAISMTNNPGIAGMMATIQYDADVFVLTGAESGEALDTLTFTAPTNFVSGCTFLWDTTKVEDSDVKDGEFLLLTFTVDENAQEGEYSILISINAYDNDLNPINPVITGGKVTIIND